MNAQEYAVWKASNLNLNKGDFVVFTEKAYSDDGKYVARRFDHGFIIEVFCDMPENEEYFEEIIHSPLDIFLFRVGKIGSTEVERYTVSGRSLVKIKDLKPMDELEMKKLFHKHPYTHIFC
jgi:hypothetical protein